MTILRIVRKKNFTVVPNHIIRDKTMSLQAKMILVTYLSNADGVEVSNSYIESTSTNGREGIASATNELIEHGYYKRDRVQVSGGRWNTTVTITTEPWQFDDDQVDDVNTTPPGYGFPAPGEPTPRDPAPKRVRTREKQTVSYESAGAESEGRRVTTGTGRQPKRRSSGMRRAEVAEESPGTGRIIGMPTSTERERRVKEERSHIAFPNSAGGLAREFGQLATEHRLNGPQQVNGAALAHSLTRWLKAEQNPDTPELIRAMFSRFFEKPGGNRDFPLWRRFLAEAPQLRVTERKSAPVDREAARREDREWLEKAAASGDIRAEKELSGENRPWMAPEYLEKYQNQPT